MAYVFDSPLIFWMKKQGPSFLKLHRAHLKSCKKCCKICPLKWCLDKLARHYSIWKDSDRLLFRPSKMGKYFIFGCGLDITLFLFFTQNQVPKLSSDWMIYHFLGWMIYHFQAHPFVIWTTLKNFPKNLSVENNWFEFLCFSSNFDGSNWRKLVKLVI